MHYRPFEEIDWCTLVEAEEVVLVLTPVFLREMDQHKDHKRGVLQTRARRMSSWLGELRRSKRWIIRHNVRVEVSSREPELDIDMAAHGLEPSVNDDKIVACMLRDAKNAPGMVLVCVTSDNTLSFKVEAAGFEAMSPPETMRLADELDPSEQEKRQLQKELAALRRRMDPEPNLGLHFEGGDDSFLVELRGLRAQTSDEIDRELAVTREGLELHATIHRSILLRPPSAKAIDRYLEELRAWMVGATKLALKHARTFDVRLQLVNQGLGNATDIEIDLTLPDIAFAARSRKLPEIADRPKEPQPEDPYAFPRVASFAAGGHRGFQQPPSGENLRRPGKAPVHDPATVLPGVVRARATARKLRHRLSNPCGLNSEHPDGHPACLYPRQRRTDQLLGRACTRRRGRGRGEGRRVMSRWLLPSGGTPEQRNGTTPDAGRRICGYLGESQAPALKLVSGMHCRARSALPVAASETRLALRRACAPVRSGYRGRVPKYVRRARQALDCPEGWQSAPCSRLLQRRQGKSERTTKRACTPTRPARGSKETHTHAFVFEPSEGLAPRSLGGGHSPPSGPIRREH